MAHYAFIDKTDIVSHVIVGRREDEVVEGISDWEKYYGDFVGQTCLRTSYNTRGGIHYTDGEPSADQNKAFRKNYAGIGYTYDETLDAFIPPQPYESWVLDEATYSWVSPVPYPEDDKDYTWDEDTTSWIEVTE